MAFNIQSPEFWQGERIPVRFTCDGEDLSPELSWEDPPEGTKSFTLIAEDPDAPMGTFVHWVLYDIPAGLKRLERGEGNKADPGQGMKHGTTGFGRIGYGGPCPPKGHGDHRYSFILKALDVETLGLGAGATKADVEASMEGHVLGEASLMGIYGR
ncbi:MAG: YbhB/YbcL family Raf kinase inhibitor-like protein [Thermodesulfobacteriota bacterium]|nr:MAG: YbhB/YbcL family Raf kinase inhibitor-like protein [Thermodesulfobacteriota bacterium]